jgi:hypothetical protein
MELLGIQWVFDRLKEILKEWQDHRRVMQQENVRAIEALLRALNETEIYFGTARSLGRDRSREEALSRLWNEASRLLRPVDADLATRCDTKGQYWADPVGWNREQLIASRVSIADMREGLNELLSVGTSVPPNASPGAPSGNSGGLGGDRRR